MNQQTSRTLSLAAAAVVGAAYAALTMALAPISYGAVQLRVSEALCILPYFLPVTAWGLYVGCILANLLTGNLFDILFGSLATLLAGLLTARLGRSARRLLSEPDCDGRLPRSLVGSQLLACLMPVVFNALIVGAVITGAYEGLKLTEHLDVFALNAAFVGLGEAAVLFLLGFFLMRYLPTLRFFREFVYRANRKT